MSIPNYEMGNLEQEEFWKFIKDPCCTGLIGQKQAIAIPPLERIWIKLDRAEDRIRERKRQRDRLSALVSEPISQAQISSRIEKETWATKARRGGFPMEWIDEMPPGTPFFPEADDVTRSSDSIPLEEIRVPPDFEGWA